MEGIRVGVNIVPVLEALVVSHQRVLVLRVVIRLSTSQFELSTLELELSALQLGLELEFGFGLDVGVGATPVGVADGVPTGRREEAFEGGALLRAGTVGVGCLEGVECVGGGC